MNFTIKKLNYFLIIIAFQNDTYTLLAMSAMAIDKRTQLDILAKMGIVVKELPILTRTEENKRLRIYFHEMTCPIMTYRDEEVPCQRSIILAVKFI